MLGSPAYVDALLGTGICIGRDSRAQALAIAALITGTRIEDATLQITLQWNLRMAGLEKLGLQGAALELRPRFTLWMLAAGIDWCHGRCAMWLQLPGVTKEHGTCFQAQ